MWPASEWSDAVDGDANREMGSEDFSYMLEARPGAYLFMGTGPGAGLHHPAFDFNDEAAPIGCLLLCPSGRAPNRWPDLPSITPPKQRPGAAHLI